MLGPVVLGDSVHHTNDMIELVTQLHTGDSYGTHLFALEHCYYINYFPEPIMPTTPTSPRTRPFGMLSRLSSCPRRSAVCTRHRPTCTRRPPCGSHTTGATRACSAVGHTSSPRTPPLLPMPARHWWGPVLTSWGIMTRWGSNINISLMVLKGKTAFTPIHG